MCRQYSIEIICEQLALSLGPEICVRAEFILRFSDKEILAGSHRKQYDRKHYMAEFHSNVLFHISLSSLEFHCQTECECLAERICVGLRVGYGHLRIQILGMQGRPMPQVFSAEIHSQPGNLGF